jgi:calcineurin-like phosphoesterase family protein
MDFITTTIDNWNSVVKVTDIVYFLGDLAVKEEYLQYAAQLNGTKHLIKGNYDVYPDEEYLKYFDSVRESVSMSTCEPGKPATPDNFMDIHMVHYPGKSRPDCFNLVGHIHGAWRVQKNMLNCGVDVSWLYPISLEQVFFFKRAITEFYDQDVWVGDHLANTAHDDRGKEGTYWEREFAGSLIETNKG